MRRALFGDDHRLPMIFQYNPLVHLLGTNDASEIVCTISRLDVLAPRIRYNVHDEGGIMHFGAVESILRELGLQLAHLNREPDAAGPRGPLPWTRPVLVPFLWVYGRSDATISVMGANIYPDDAESVIYGDTSLAPLVHSFCLSLDTDSTGTPRPCISLEARQGVAGGAIDPDRVASLLRDNLASMDLDFREAVSEFPAAMLPIVTVHEAGTGPFAEDQGRIKQRRIVAPQKA